LFNIYEGCPPLTCVLALAVYMTHHALDQIKNEYGRPRTITVPPPAGGNDNNSGSGSGSGTGVTASFEFAGVMQEPGTAVMVDLGSGAGKPVFAAAALYPFKRVVGIEARVCVCVGGGGVVYS
jgi:hypothetical protein